MPRKNSNFLPSTGDFQWHCPEFKTPKNVLIVLQEEGQWLARIRATFHGIDTSDVAWWKIVR